MIAKQQRMASNRNQAAIVRCGSGAREFMEPVTVDQRPQLVGYGDGLVPGGGLRRPVDTTVSEARSEHDDLDVHNEPVALSRLERLGFPAGVRPFREALLVGGTVAIVVTYVYKLWNAHWKVPFNYSGDALGTSAYAKAIIENGWYLSNPRLGAPFTADWRDFPLGGANLHYLALKILGSITGNYALAVNFYFLFGFFAIALIAYFVARFLRFSVATSLVVSVLFAFLPFHAFRNIAHLSRGEYYPIPLAVLVILWVGRYRTELLRRDDKRWRVRRGRLLFALVVAVVIGSTDDQNVVFLASIIMLLALIELLRDRDWRPVALAAIVSVAAFGALFLNNTPFLIARAERGPNTVVANRPLTDQDQYGLRPVNLILPTPGHRIGALNTIATKSARGQVTASETAGTSLGIIGSVGLLWSLGAALALALGRRKPSRSTAFVAQLGVCNLIAILIGTIGGFSFLLALAGFGTYRTWNRISIFIAFFSLLAVAVGFEKVFAALRARTKQEVGIAVVTIVAGIAILGGALDQTTPRYIPNFKLIAARFDQDATFYHSLEKMVPARSMIFQLPIAAFPEQGPINNMGDYSEFAAYLQTKNLRWSYGAIKGRPEGDWQLQNLNLDNPVALLAQVAAIGFQGVVIDRTGFADNAQAFLTAAAPYTGAPALRSPDDRLLYLDLTGLRGRLDRELGANGVAQSAQIALGKLVQFNGFSYPESACTATRRWAVERAASVVLDNTSNAPVTVSASSAFTANPAASSIAVHGPGDDESVALQNGAGSWQHELTLPTGKSTVTFTLSGPRFAAPHDARSLQFAMSGYSFGPEFDSPALAFAAKSGPPCPSGG